MAQPEEADHLVPDLDRPSPPITAEMRANARENPNSWLFVIDEAFDPDEDVPNWAMVGAYPVDARGRIVEEFHHNLEYRPSPRALGLPDPRNELERVLQLVWTDHLPVSQLPRAVLRGRLYVYAISPLQRNLTGCHDRTGRVVVPAYTDRSLIPLDWPTCRALTGRALAPLLVGHPLAINPNQDFGAVVPAERLLSALARG